MNLFVFIYHVLVYSDFCFARLSISAKDFNLWINMERFKSSNLNNEKCIHFHLEWDWCHGYQMYEEWIRITWEGSQTFAKL